MVPAQMSRFCGLVRWPAAGHGLGCGGRASWPRWDLTRRRRGAL